MPIVFVFCIIGIIVLGITAFNIIEPFIWQQKLNKISVKYMFIIEKFGYLTPKEKNDMMLDLKENGFKIENISVDAPDKIKNYGELIEFCIKYRTSYKKLLFLDGKINIKEIPLIIKADKYTYSKI